VRFTGREDRGLAHMLSGMKAQDNGRTFPASEKYLHKENVNCWNGVTENHKLRQAQRCRDHLA